MITLKQPLNKTSLGLTLVEVLVTIAITSIGLMGLLSLQMQAMKVTQDAGNYTHSTWIFNDLSSRIKVNRSFSSNYAVGLVSCAAIPAPVCSNYFDGTNTITSATCTGPQLAAWDLYEVACGTPRTAATIQGNSIANLSGSSLTVGCVVAGCDNGDELLLTLTWRARIDVTEIDGRIRQANDNLITQTRPVTP
jgi:type IV pilus assembly protein PilV